MQFVKTYTQGFCLQYGGRDLGVPTHSLPPEENRPLVQLTGSGEGRSRTIMLLDLLEILLISSLLPVGSYLAGS